MNRSSKTGRWHLAGIEGEFISYSFITEKYDFDGAYLSVWILPSTFNVPFDQSSGQYCEVIDKKVININNFDALQITTRCFIIDTDTYIDDYYIQASDKVILIEYQGLDDYVFNLHYSDFINSLGSLRISNTLPLSNDQLLSGGSRYGYSNNELSNSLPNNDEPVCYQPDIYPDVIEPEICY